MKRIISIVSVAIAMVFSANAAGIDFNHDLSWKQALEKAKSENRLIFVDFYTQWCGPCYNMAHTVFTLPEVGHFYNNNFVNLKIDTENGEGIELAKKYGIHSFPTYVFIDPSTEEPVHRSSSRQTPEQFIQTGKDALTPEKRSFYLNSQYENGNLDRKLLTDYINYHNSVYARNKVSKAFDQLIETGADLSDADVWELYVNAIPGINKYLKQVSDNYPAFCNKFGKEAVDAKLAKETGYGDPAEIAALCDYEGKDFNLKMIEINSLLRAKDYDAAATRIDAMIADPNVDQQKLIGQLKFMARVNYYKADEMPDSWFNKCIGYLRYIAYNQTERDDANIHQEYAAALEKMLLRNKADFPAVTNEPAAGKKVYDMRPADLKQKPKRNK